MDYQEAIQTLQNLDNDALFTAYVIGAGYTEIRSIQENTNQTSAVTRRLIKTLENKSLVKSRVKPGTGKKYRPTKLYRLAQGLAKEMLLQVADEKGLDFEKKLEKRLEDLHQKSLLESKSKKAETPVNDKTRENLDNNQQQVEVMNSRSSDTELKEELKSHKDILSRFPSLPEYDSTWSDKAKADWIALFRQLVELSQNKND